MDVVPEASWLQRLVAGSPSYPLLGKIYGVALHGSELLVCETAENVVVIFDLSEGSMRLLGGEQPGRLQKPVNVTVDDDGTRYVADTILRRILVYDASDRYQTAFGDPDRWRPTDVAIAKDRLYITDAQNHQVVVLDKASGRELDRLGSRGAGPGQFFVPTNLALGPDGSLYISDTGNARVVHIDPTGRPLGQIGGLGDTLGRFTRPKGVAVDRQGRVYVADAASESVQLFDPEGRLLLFFGGAGNRPGRLNLPAKVAISYDGTGLFEDQVADGYQIDYLLLVTSQYGLQKVSVFGFLSQGGGSVGAGAQRPGS